MKIYVASSWRNLSLQQGAVTVLRRDGHEVYDFTNPAPGNMGFAWSQVDADWEAWEADAFRVALEHPVAQEGFKLDMDALRWCDACVLVLPCGRSAHLEIGWAAGAGKRTIVFAPGRAAFEPELMYLMCDAIVVTTDELRAELAGEPVAR